LIGANQLAQFLQTLIQPRIFGWRCQIGNRRRITPSFSDRCFRRSLGSLSGR
jgi:hypothetical protein